MQERPEHELSALRLRRLKPCIILIYSLATGGCHSPNRRCRRAKSRMCFSVVAARAERGLQSAGVLVSEEGFGILRARLQGAHAPAG